MAYLLMLAACPKGCQHPEPAYQEYVVDGPPLSMGPSLFEEVGSFLAQDPPALERAMKIIDIILDLDPINREGLRLKEEVVCEMANREVYTQCLDDFDRGRYLEAYDCFLRLPEGSRFFEKSLSERAECRRQLSKYYIVNFRGNYTAGDWKKAHENCVKHMELNPCDLDTYEQLKVVERKLRGIYGMEFTPFELDCQVAGISEKDLGIDPEEAIRHLCPNRQLGDAMMKYFQGKSDPAIVDLQKLIGSKDRGVSAQARKLVGDVRVVRGKYAEGISLMNRGRAKEAKEQLEQALDVDARLMPKGVVSFYRRELGKRLVARLYQDGLELYNRKELEASFKTWTECLQRWPDETDCKRGLGMLEEIADRMMEEVSRLESREAWTDAAGLMKGVLTITSPEAMSHKAAKLKLQEYDP